MTLSIWMPVVRTGTGSEVYSRVLAKRLRERGHRVQLDAVPHFYQYAPWLAPISPPAMLDVILANSWNASAFAKKDVPLVSVCHLVVHDPRLAPYKTRAQSAFHRLFVLPMEQAAVRRATVNIAVSPLVARQMRQLLKADRVVTVNNGVDTEFFTPGHRPPRPAGEPLRLLFVGKPSLRKGFDIAAKILDRLGDRVTFTCVGPEPGPSLPRPRGTYTGVLDRHALRDAYRQADLLLFPSRMEGLSLAVAEAMACGLPPVVCKGSGMDEVIHSEAAIVQGSSETTAFVAEIEKVIEDPARQQRMSALAHRFAAENLSEQAWVEQTENLLLRCAR